MKHLGDITKINGADIEPVDVVCGGSPCQDLSVAGKRAGLDGERSGLFMEQIRVIKEMREHDKRSGRSDEFIRPRYMVWENVPGAFSSGSPKGADFKCVLEETIRIVCPEAPDLPLPEAWTGSGCIYDDMGGWSVAWRVHDAQFWGVPQRRKRIALLADFGGLSAPEIQFVRKGVHRNSEPCGAPWKATTGCAGNGTEKAVAYFLQGNGIDRADTAGCNGKGWRENQCYTLNTIDRPAVMVIENHSADSRVKISEKGVFQTLTSRMGTGGGNLPMLMETISTSKSSFHTVANVDAVATPAASDYKDPPTIFRVGDCDGKVRRITPLECERLQGYPDGWTDIGEWTDSKGKKHECTDSARYKALGNSIAIPYWKALAKKISAQYDRDITMGSFFDGIGGFPYCFESVNGKGSARWASEIEEFPIAVTKIRFPELSM